MRILSDEQGTNELEAAEHIIGWLDATMDASYWFNEVDLEPEQAAMILCQFNPNEVTLEQVQDSMNDVTGPRDLVLLLREFKRFAKRSLLQWIQVAQKKPLRYHPWIDQYLNARKLVGSPVVEPDRTDGVAADIRPMARLRDTATSHAAAAQATELQGDHFAAILAALGRFGAMGKDGIAKHARLNGVQVCRRLVELQRMGLAKLTGKTVLSAAGRQEREWVAA